jgi:hypothetical protein
MVIAWLSSGLSSRDFSMDRNTIPDAMKEAGFAGIETRPFMFPHGGTLDFIVARKK